VSLLVKVVNSRLHHGLGLEPERTIGPQGLVEDISCGGFEETLSNFAVFSPADPIAFSGDAI